MQNRQTHFLGGNQFGVIRPERRCNHDGVWVSKLFSVVTDVDFGAQLPQRRNVGTVPDIGTGDSVSHSKY